MGSGGPFKGFQLPNQCSNAETYHPALFLPMGTPFALCPTHPPHVLPHLSTPHRQTLSSPHSRSHIRLWATRPTTHIPECLSFSVILTGFGLETLGEEEGKRKAEEKSISVGFTSTTMMTSYLASSILDTA